MDLKKIYNLHGGMVYNLALQYVQNVEDAEEITQDVFINVNDKLSTFKKESELKTWIYRIAINKSLDYIRAKKSKKRWSFYTPNRAESVEITLADTQMNHPGFQLEQKESLEKIFKCINQLPESQKTAILLLKVDGLEMKEVAGIMDISYKALESVFQRAKTNLKKIMDQNEGM